MSDLIKMERTFNAPVTMLWEALTDNDKLKQWYFDFNGNFKAEVGHVFDWEAGPPDGRMWLHRGTILEVEENKKLVQTWIYPGYEGEGKLTWELHPLPDDKTLLIMTFEFIVPFDPTEYELRRSNFEGGWDEIINHLLPKYING